MGEVPRIGIVLNQAPIEEVTGPNPTNTNARAFRSAMLVDFLRYRVRDVHDVEKGIVEAKRDGAQALYLTAHPLFLNAGVEIAVLATRHRIPAMFSVPEIADSGGLVAYGSMIGDDFRRAAKFVDRILRGARPGDLPIEEPSSYRLHINLEAARAIGLEVPRPLILQGDKVVP